MIYAIGDIHGQLKMLTSALKELETRLEPEDAIVFLGDYIDRGPDSAGVIDRLLDFRDQHTWTVFLRGNHEDLLMRSLCGDDRREGVWLFNGGLATLESFGLGGQPNWQKKLPDWAIEFLDETVLEVKSQHFHFVHAGIVPDGVETEVESDLDPRMWIREPFIDCQDKFERTVVFGHTPQPGRRPLVQPNKVGLDTGACMRGGRLSVAGFDDTKPGESTPEFSLFQVRDNGAIVHLDVVGSGFTPALASEVLAIRAIRQLAAAFVAG